MTTKEPTGTKETTKEAAKDLIAEATATLAKELPGIDRPLIDKQAHRRNISDAQDALAREFRTLLSDTEKLLKHTADSAEEQTQALRDKLRYNLERGKVLLQERRSALEEQGSAAAKATEDYVVDHPWQSVGIATGIGFVLGLLARRR